MSKEHKIKLTLEYCRRCNAAHPPGEHLAKPKVSRPDKTAEDLARSLNLPPKATAKKWGERMAKQFAKDVAPKAAKMKGAPKSVKATERDLAKRAEPLFTAAAASTPFSTNPKDLKHPIDQLVEDLKDGTLEHVLKGGVPGDKKYNELKAAAAPRIVQQEGFDPVVYEGDAVREPTPEELKALFKEAPAIIDASAKKKRTEALIAARGQTKAAAISKVMEQVMSGVVDAAEADPRVASAIEADSERMLKAATPKKKRTKAEVQALVDAEEARKRALKNGRQQRWRDKQKKKPKKRGKK